jgi:hypothetical protein
MVKTISVQEASELTGLSPRTLQELRSSRNKQHFQGVHYQKVGHRTVIYYLDMLMDWRDTRHCPHVHDQRVAQQLKVIEKQQSRQSKSH